MNHIILVLRNATQLYSAVGARAQQGRAGLHAAAKRTMVEIRRAVVHEAKPILVYEPTATLPPEEKKYFSDLGRDLKRRGVPIGFISPALEEALILADGITIL